MRNRSVKSVAFGGMFAAVALVIMCLGGLIPLATFVCPMLATLVGQIVLRACGEKTAWCWYGTVAILSAFLAPDKEGAAVFVFLGYYPIIRKYFPKNYDAARIQAHIIKLLEADYRKRQRAQER